MKIHLDTLYHRIQCMNRSNTFFIVHFVQNIVNKKKKPRKVPF